jgi:hypothetical protein
VITIYVYNKFGALHRVRILRESSGVRFGSFRRLKSLSLFRPWRAVDGSCAGSISKPLVKLRLGVWIWVFVV